MEPVLILSPHLDDAVLSCGQFMAGRPDCVVVTLFAGIPPDADTLLTPYDHKCGFESALDAVECRRHEDQLAVGALHAEAVHGDFLDHQYEHDLHDDWKRRVELADFVRAHVSVHDPQFVLAPLGLAHPDHETTSNAALTLADDVELWLYEELPLRVLEPEVVADRLTFLRALGWQLDRDFIGTGSHDLKDIAVTEYGSQLEQLEQLGDGSGLLCCHVPERYWRVRT